MVLSGFILSLSSRYPLVSVSGMSRKSMQNGVIYFLPDFIVKGHFCPSKTVSERQIGQKRTGKCTFFDFFCTKIWSCQKKAVLLHPLSKKKQKVILKICGNSSVGRARPCQGRGREFESRFPLTNGKEQDQVPAFLF